MIFGLFRSRLPSAASVVDQALGGTLVPETSFPRRGVPQSSPDYPPLRECSLTAPPPEGRLTASFDGAPAHAHLVDGPAGTVAIVSERRDRLACSVWNVDPDDPTRLGTQRQGTAALWAGATWVSRGLALPAGRLLLEMRHYAPGPPRETYYLYDVATDLAVPLGNSGRLDLNGDIRHLQLAPDTVLVLYETERVRIKSEHYVHLHDHLVLFSPRHPDGLSIARLGIDDGSVGDWCYSGGKLWMQTHDGRRWGSPAVERVWSLPLSRVL